jgi:hypothetical protein
VSEDNDQSRETPGAVFGRCALCGYGAPIFWLSPSELAGRQLACPVCGQQEGISILLNADGIAATDQWVQQQRGTLPPSDPIDIESCEISVRLLDGLRRLSISDLRQVSTFSARDFLNLGNFGRKSLKELAAVCARFGLQPPIGLASIPKADDAPAAAHAVNSTASHVDEPPQAAVAQRAIGPDDLPSIVDALNDIIRSRLPERLTQILQARLGIGEGEGETLAVLGEKLGVSRERVRQLEWKGLRRLRGLIRSSKHASAAYLAKEVCPRVGAQPETAAAALLQMAECLPTHQVRRAAQSLLYVLGQEPISAARAADIVQEVMRQQAEDLLRISRERSRRTERIDADGLVAKIVAGTSWPTRTIMYAPGEFPLERRRARETGQTDAAGAFESVRGYGLVAFESGLELALLSKLDHAESIAWYLEQPLRIRYRAQGAERSHYPDALVLLTDGRAILLEFKPMFGMTWQVTLRKALAAQRHAFAMGWGYALCGEKGLTLLEAAKTEVPREAAAAVVEEAQVPNGARYDSIARIRDEHGLSRRQVVGAMLQNNLAVSAPPWRLVPVPAEYGWRKLVVDQVSG